jgi:8-oxo-dGTP pyrophosphatase MutT (NUDIX family)
MTGSSILPVTLYKGKLYFLFGKENEKEQSAKGFSDFGGTIETGETVYDTAMREGAEELTGFLGNETTIRNHIRNNGGVYHINHNDQYHVHLFYLEYDENLPKYYNNNHHFLWENMNTSYLSKTKLFEKIEIKWFSIKEMKERRNEFREFYREILDKFIIDISNIEKFIKSKQKNKAYIETNRQTKRRYH